jgi:large subunit ribosomal protein L5
MAEEKEKKNKGAKPTEAEIAARKAAKRAKVEVEVDTEETARAAAEPAPPARLIAHYREKVVPALQEKLGMKNLMATPRIEKIVISMGLGKIATSGGADAKAKFEQAERELSIIAGQKPVRCKAKKSVANFKVREGQETGLKVTLRGSRMYEFLDRVVTLAIPRVKDFRGLDPNGFDKSGNYNFGFTEQTVFPEVDGASVTFQQGMNITMVTTAKSPDHGRELLKGFGFPFREKSKLEER